MDKANLYEGLTELCLMERAKNYNHWIESVCSKYIYGDLLEVGAGIGTYTHNWLKYAETVKVFEIAPNCYSILKHRFSANDRIELFLNDVQIYREELLEKFDSAVSVNVFEHVKNDILGFENVYKYLKPGGLLILFVPAFQILYGKTDQAVGHYRRYSKKELSKTLKGIGFQVRDMRYVNLLGFFSWLLYKNKSDVLTEQKIDFFDRIFVPVLSRTERYYSPPLGQSLFLVATKEGSLTF